MGFAWDLIYKCFVCLRPICELKKWWECRNAKGRERGKNWDLRERTESFVGLEMRTNTNPPNHTNIKDFYTELKLCLSQKVDRKLYLGKYIVSNSGRVNKGKLQWTQRLKFGSQWWLGSSEKRGHIWGFCLLFFYFYFIFIFLSFEFILIFYEFSNKSNLSLQCFICLCVTMSCQFI